MNRFKFSLAGSISLVAYGYVQNTTNGKFPSEATNKRPRQNFFNYTGKAGVAYKLNAASSVEANGMYGKRAPLFSDAYPAPRITGETLENLRNETLIAGDLNYLFANPSLDIRASGFFTQTMNRSMVRGYYDDDRLSRMSLGISGLNTRHFGGDLSAKIKITPEFSLNLAASYGVYKYCSDPLATLIQENTGEKPILRDTLRLNGKRPGGTPQTAFSGGAMYDFQRWWVGFNANYAAANYIDPNPLRFASASVDLGNEQAKLKAVFTLDLYGGYTFEFGEKKKKAVGLNVNVQNILGTKNGYLGAYEPFGPITADNAGKHDPHYAYAYGRTMYLMLSFVF
jgi:outer membrane receptor protein involved in Fe transport